MSSKKKKKPTSEDHCNTTETEEGTVALQKKRSRRVSFAENTSVHFFDRDEDSEAPSDPLTYDKNNNVNNDNNNDQWEQFNRDLGFVLAEEDLQNREKGEEEEEEEEDGDDDVETARLFFRPIGSPASTAGSTTSNDEDNFFGPVSASFIRPGRLSDSGASDIHDITMDSTAFSQHFRSLAKSDTGEDLKTPTTGVHLSFEENTPNQNTIPGSNLGSAMLMNSAKKPVSASSTSVEKLSDGSDSNEMSLVEGNPKRYDYGRLSFGWEEALLADGVKDLHTDDNISSPIRDRTSTSTNELNHSSDLLNKGMLSAKEHDAPETSPKTDSHVNSGSAANEESGIPQLDGTSLTKEPNASEKSPKADSHVNSDTTANQVSGMPQSDGVFSNKKPDASEMSPKADSHAVNSGIVANRESKMPQLDVSSQQLTESPLARSLSSLSRRSQSVFLEPSVNVWPLSTPQNHVLSVTDGTRRRAGTVPSVQKSISKLRILDASPFASNLSVKMNAMLSSESLYKTPPCNTSLHRNIEDADIKHVDASAAWRDQSRVFALGNRETDSMSNMKPNTVSISGKLVDGSYSRGLAEIAKVGTSPVPRSAEVIAREQSGGLTRLRSLVSQLTWSGNETKMNRMTSEDLAEKIVDTPRKDSVFTTFALDHENIMEVVGTPGKSVHSLEESVIKKSVSTSSPVSKRSREDTTSGASECVEEISRLERSPKVQKSVECEVEVLSGHHNGSNIEASTVGDESRLRPWTDILSEFLGKKMLPPSIDKLDFHSIGVLEDRLVNLQRLQTYEMHHNVIQSQKSVEDLANLQHKRTADAKTLLHKVLHERAKLQLMRVKQEKLQRNVQILRHGIQEAQLLKLNSLPHITAGCARDANINNSHSQSINIRGRDEEEVPSDKITELRQLRDTIESKLMSLTNSVHSSCKLKGVLSHDDTISVVHDYLKKKECCNYIRSDLQLWKVHNIYTTNGYRNLVLNYLDFVIQRIRFKAGSAASLTISNELNEVTISKSFPNMDAWTALSFTLNAIATQKYVVSSSLIQETQITSSVLGNLVDVAEEVQQARFELQNLTNTRFCSPSDGQLDLCFHFIGMKSGRKVELTLDVSCLKLGIYPSDITPYKLEGSSVLSPESLPEQLSAEIRAAIQSLEVGFWRILRICRTISQVVQAWSR